MPGAACAGIGAGCSHLLESIIFSVVGVKQPNHRMISARRPFPRNACRDPCRSGRPVRRCRPPAARWRVSQGRTSQGRCRPKARVRGRTRVPVSWSGTPEGGALEHLMRRGDIGQRPARRDVKSGVQRYYAECKFHLTHFCDKLPLHMTLFSGLFGHESRAFGGRRSREKRR